MTNCLIVALGGALGALSRYLIGLVPVQSNGFPIKTFLINVAGAFLIGIVAALAAKNAISPKLVTFIKIGICGGFTTFSSFSLETTQLIDQGHWKMAAGYVLLSILCGLIAVFTAGKLFE
jgi:CrcB protein